jgi:hypothetical protein
MNSSGQQPKPDGDCAYCREPITPGWDTSGNMQSSWFCSALHFSKAAERAAWVDELCLCGLLVLDEPDKLKPSDGLVEVIYGVLDERFAEGRLTILTTNAGGRELERRWSLEFGPYLVRRIREFCLAINFDPQT